MNLISTDTLQLVAWLLTLIEFTLSLIILDDDTAEDLIFSDHRHAQP